MMLPLQMPFEKLPEIAGLTGTAFDPAVAPLKMTVLFGGGWGAYCVIDRSDVRARSTWAFC